MTWMNGKQIGQTRTDMAIHLAMRQMEDWQTQQHRQQYQQFKTKDLFPVGNKGGAIPGGKLGVGRKEVVYCLFRSFCYDSEAARGPKVFPLRQARKAICSEEATDHGSCLIQMCSMREDLITPVLAMDCAVGMG